MLSKTELYTQYTVLEKGQVQLRKTTRIYDDGILISEKHHRSIKEPGADIADLPANMSASIASFWTTEVLEAWDSFISSSSG